MIRWSSVISDGDDGPAAPSPVRTARVDPTTQRVFAQVRRFRLVVEEGPDAGAVFESTSERATVGTHAAASFPLTDPTVSRFHCEISLGAAHPQIRDLGSRNGTWL